MGYLRDRDDSVLDQLEPTHYNPYRIECIVNYCAHVSLCLPVNQISQVSACRLSANIRFLIAISCPLRRKGH